MSNSPWVSSFAEVLASHPIIERLFFASLELALLSAVVILILRLFRIRSARLASLLWLLALIKPVVSLCLPPLIPVIQLSAPTAAEMQTHVETRPYNVASTTAAPQSVPDMNEYTAPSVPLPASTEVLPDRPSTSLIPPSPAQSRWLMPWPKLLVAIWLMGISVMIALALVNRLRLTRILRTASPPPTDIAARYHALADEMKLRTKLRLLLTDKLDSPALAGTLRPVILLPAWLTTDGLTSNIEWALRHEITHWKHGDPWANLLRSITQSLLFFHPVVWFASRKWEENAELACDRALVNSTDEARHYAETLFQLLRRLHGRRRPYALSGLFATRTQIGKRIAELATAPFPSHARLGGLTLFTLAVLAGLAFTLGGRVVDGAVPSQVETDDTQSPGVTIKATVLDTDGKPAGVVQMNPWHLSKEHRAQSSQEWNERTVWVEPESGRVWQNEGNTQTRDEYTFDNLEPGTYFISAYSVHKDDPRDPTPFGVSDRIDIESADSTQEVTVNLLSGVATELRFIDAETNRPVENVEYILRYADGFPVGYGSRNFYASTDQTGIAVFRALPPKHYVIDARTTSRTPEDRVYALKEGPQVIEVHEDGKSIDIPMIGRAQTEEEIAQRWPFSVFGKVTDEEGNPIPDVTIRANCGMGTLMPTGSTVSREDGSYTLLFQPGMHWLDEETDEWRVGHQVATIFAFKEGFYEYNLCRQGGLSMADSPADLEDSWTAEPEMVVFRSQPYRLDFVMAPACTVSGVLLSGTGEPVAGQRITMKGPELYPSSSVLKQFDTDEQGRFTLQDIPCKQYWFETDGVGRSKPIYFLAAGNYEIELNLSATQLMREVLSVPEGVSVEKAITIPVPVRSATVDGATVLSYVDNSAEGKRSLAASGHAVGFSRQQGENYLEAVAIYASRYGTPEPPNHTFFVYVMNEQHQVLSAVPFPYSLIERGDMQWYTLPMPSIEVTEEFYVGLAFNPHSTMGIYLGYDNSSGGGHSFTGLPEGSYQPVKEDYDWMVNVELKEEATGTHGVMRLADWSPPVYEDPFKDCVEITYDIAELGMEDSETLGMQSYGGAGPAIQFQPFTNVQPELSKRQIVGLRIYSSRYGSGYDLGNSSDWHSAGALPDNPNLNEQESLGTTMSVNILDNKDVIVHTEKMPYSLFSYKPKWVDFTFQEPVPIDKLGTTEPFMVAIDPDANQTKGIYFHYRKDPPSNHSFVGTVAKGFKPVTDREWLIKLYVSEGDK